MGKEMTTSRRAVLSALVLAAVAVVLWGGYAGHWHWTGIDGHTASLWDWMQLLLLPLAVAVVPIWMSREAKLEHRVKLVAVAVALAFVPVVLAGYLVPWHWTGFSENRLWDWLNLVALPFAVAMLPLWPEVRRAWTARHTVIAAGGLFLAAIVILAGYLVPWGWTGFTGNTLWNWLHLLLLPLLLPTVIVPAVRPLARARMVPVAEQPPPGPASRDR